METAVAGAAGGVFLPPPPRGVAEPGAAHAAVLADLAARDVPSASASEFGDGLSDGPSAIAPLAMPGRCSLGGAFALGAKKLAMDRIPAPLAGCLGGAIFRGALRRPSGAQRLRA